MKNRNASIRAILSRAVRMAAWGALIVSSGLPAGGAAEPAETVTEQQARDLVDQVVAEVEQVRGLAFKEPVPVALIDDDTAREHLLGRLERFGLLDQLPALGRAYELLGLLPPETDVLETYLSALREQAGGFYDPGTRSYYLLDDMPALLAPSITAHELTHALEDQHYDMDARLREVLDDDDRIFARGAVHEGSAMLVMMQFVTRRVLSGKLDPQALQALARTQAEQAAALEAMPPVLLRQLIGPYLLGTFFLLRNDPMALAAGYPVEDVEAVYENGPRSSEQILHPAKYWDAGARDDPRPVDTRGAGGLLGKGWTLAHQGVLGELSLAVMTGAETPLELQNPLDPVAGKWTNPAASGWDGDRWELWTRGGDAVVLLATVWDSPEDAQEFADALAGRKNLHVSVQDDRVAVIAGKLTGKKRARVLVRMLDEGPRARVAPRRGCVEAANPIQ